jgi:AcrR family transcriptional regulator
MGRVKLYVREELLDKAIAVFWEKGFGSTTLQDLEKATGVNKSGIYAEFRDKEDLFMASLERYLALRQGREILNKHPLGWKNIERFLREAQTCPNGQRGCYAVNSMRDLAGLPGKARKMIEDSYQVLREGIQANIRTAQPEANAKALGELILTFFSGLCIEQNLYGETAHVSKKIRDFMEQIAPHS